MHRREFLLYMTGGLTAVGLSRMGLGATPANDREKPNILIVMADQMTAALTGAYGHPVVKTPALNQLCAEGVRFDAAYTNSPICTPARAAMLSGRYVSRTRTYDNAAILPSDVPTYAHHLRLAGYETVVSGKLHLVGADQLHGFERRLTADIYPSAFNWTPDWRDYKENGIKNQKGKSVEEKRIGVRNRTRQLDYDSETQSRALEFLRSARKGAGKRDSRPFCLLVSFTHPHPPYVMRTPTNRETLFLRVVGEGSFNRELSKTLGKRVKSSGARQPYRHFSNPCRVGISSRTGKHKWPQFLESSGRGGRESRQTDRH